MNKTELPQLPEPAWCAQYSSPQMRAYASAAVAAERERCAQQFVENGREIGRQEERERWVLHCTAIGDLASTGGNTVPEVMAALARISAMAYMGPNVVVTGTTRRL